MRNKILGIRVALSCVILVIHMGLVAGCGSDEDEQVSDDSSGSTTAPPSTGEPSSNQPTTTAPATTTPAATTPSQLPGGGFATLEELLVGMTRVGDLAARDKAMSECISQGRKPHWMQDAQGAYWLECCPVGTSPVFNFPDRGRCKP